MPLRRSQAEGSKLVRNDSLEHRALASCSIGLDVRPIALRARAANGTAPLL